MGGGKKGVLLKAFIQEMRRTYNGGLGCQGGKSLKPVRGSGWPGMQDYEKVGEMLSRLGRRNDVRGCNGLKTKLGRAGLTKNHLCGGGKLSQKIST